MSMSFLFYFEQSIVTFTHHMDDPKFIWNVDRDSDGLGVRELPW